MTVLICEYEEVMLTAIEFRMKKAGFKVIRAKNGKEAVKQIKTHVPGLIVTDMVLPKTNVLDLIGHIRNVLNVDAPIVMITGLDDNADEEILEGFRLGADDFVTKPFKPAELVLRIKRILQDRGIELVREKIN